MNIKTEDKKIEAVKRLELLEIYPETIKQFKEDGIVSVSEPPIGAFFWVDAENAERIKDFEREHNALVYLVVRSYTTIGKMDSYFYVSDYSEEWEMDRNNLHSNEAFVYVYNHDDKYCSEFGRIGFRKTLAAGLVRTW